MHDSGTTESILRLGLLLRSLLRRLECAFPLVERILRLLLGLALRLGWRGNVASISLGSLLLLPLPRSGRGLLRRRGRGMLRASRCCMLGS